MTFPAAIQALPVVLATLAGAALLLAGFLAARLRSARREAGHLFELAPDPICVAGPDGRLERVNPAFERALGYSAEELLGRPLTDLAHPDDRESALRSASRWFDKGGEEHWLEWTSATFPGERLNYAVARDVTGRKALEREVERLSEHDPLTGVFNRGRFDEELSLRLSTACSEERGGALLLIDLDRFKRLNDELGHAAGDLALREVARVLDENTRGSDVVGRDADGIVARVGGDEFAVLLSEIGPVEAALVGKRLVTALEETELRFEGAQVPLAVSVGIAPYDGRDGVDPEGLMALADRAMYVVKAGGGGGSAEADPASAPASS